MPRTATTNVYKFSELSERAQKKALETYRYINVEFGNWYEPTYDHFKEEFAEPAGFEVTKMYFTGFASQGDGAMFEGHVTDFTPFIQNINPHVKKAIEKGAVQLSWSVTHAGHYYHEYCSDIEFDTGDNYPCKYLGQGNWSGNIYSELQKVGQAIKERYYGLCRKLYRLLEEEHGSETEDEQVRETIEINNYEFKADGSRFKD